MNQILAPTDRETGCKARCSVKTSFLLKNEIKDYKQTNKPIKVRQNIFSLDIFPGSSERVPGYRVFQTQKLHLYCLFLLSSFHFNLFSYSFRLFSYTNIVLYFANN